MRRSSYIRAETSGKDVFAMLGPYHRGLMARVARVFHKATFRGGAGGSWKAAEGGEGYIPAYICAASIWTYDGNNLEALGARRTCKPGRACTELPAAGDVLRVRRRRYPQGRIRRRVCHGGGS